MGIKLDSRERRERKRALRAVLAADPGAHEYVELAELFLDEGQYAEAESIVRNSLRLDPTHLDGRVLLARIYMARDRLEAAESELRKVQRVRPNGIASTMLLADLLLDTDRTLEAVSYTHLTLPTTPYV